MGAAAYRTAIPTSSNVGGVDATHTVTSACLKSTTRASPDDCPVPEVQHTGPPWTIPQREPPRPTMAVGPRDLHQAVAEDDNGLENECSSTKADDGLGD